jgi:hypothetical protein
MGNPERKMDLGDISVDGNIILKLGLSMCPRTGAV